MTLNVSVRSPISLQMEARHENPAQDLFQQRQARTEQRIACVAVPQRPCSSGKGRRFRERFKNNRWTGIWTDTIYEYTHFHSNAHEVLGIADGTVTIRLGGDEGRLFRLMPGERISR